MALNYSSIGIWVLRLAAAIIMLQTLFYKFSGAEESVYIFSTLHMEPWGRIGIGILELISSALILYPRTTGIGSALGVGLMAGALFFHFTKLGLVVMNDGGQLFIYALLVFTACCALLFIYRRDIFILLKLHF